jgi:hypothetical protein
VQWGILAERPSPLWTFLLFSHSLLQNIPYFCKMKMFIESIHLKTYFSHRLL